MTFRVWYRIFDHFINEFTIVAFRMNADRVEEI